MITCEEFFVEFEGYRHEFCGRVSVFELNNEEQLAADIDIIQSESGKIVRHLGTVYSNEGKKDLLSLAYHKLKIFTQNPSV